MFDGLAESGNPPYRLFGDGGRDIGGGSDPELVMQDGELVEREDPGLVQPPKIRGQIGDRRVHQERSFGLVDLTKRENRFGIDIRRRMGDQPAEIGKRIDVLRTHERFGPRQTCGFGDLSTKPGDRGEL